MSAGSQSKLLVIDDDAGLLRLMAKALTRDGFTVSTAASPPEIQARLAEGPYTLMLIDLRLGDLDARDLLAELGRQHISIPFIVITGQGDERVAVDMMKQGALDYLVKDAEFLMTMPTRVRRAVDVVQQKQRLAEAEQALKREHAFISAILNTAGALLIVLDADGHIIRFNRAAEQLTGYRSSELVGKSFHRTLVPEAEQKEVGAMFQRLLQEQRDIQHQNHIKTKIGQSRLITWSNTCVGEPGGPRFILKTGIDITEHRELERQLLEISGREQKRIGQDLHDGLGQHLTGIELMSECLEQALARKKRPEAEQAAKISEHVREAIRQTKSLARGLSPVELERNGLMSALQELCDSTAEICRVRCDFECPSPILIESNVVATHLYRIAQEAVNNAVKHGHGRAIHLKLAPLDSSRYLLSVQDDGCGFQPGKSAGSGMGLGIMHYRASEIGATLEILSEPSQGTEVRCLFHRTNV